MKGRKFREAVEAEVERRAALAPMRVRTMMICFRDKSVEIDGRKITTQSDCLAIPILATDRVVITPGEVL